MRVDSKQLLVAAFNLIAVHAVGAQISADTNASSAVVREHLELVNAGKWQRASEYFDVDVRHHLGSWQSGEERIVQGRSTLARNFEDIFRTFPDWRMDVVEMVAQGDDVVVRCRVSGTHRGMSTTRVNGGFLLGVKPTGKRFEVQHIHWYKVRNGKIVDHYTNRDDAGMARQLGLLPPG